MPYKQKLGVEKKIEIIRDYLNNRISMSEAARRGGVVRDTQSPLSVRKWSMYSASLKSSCVSEKHETEGLKSREPNSTSCSR